MRIFPKKSKQCLTAYILSILCITSVGVYAATEHWEDASLALTSATRTPVSDNTNWQEWKSSWEKTKTNFEQVSIAPGADVTKLNFGWYSKSKSSTSEVRVADNKDMKNSKTFKGTNANGTVIGTTMYYSNKVTATDFKPGHTYWYQVRLNGEWQAAQKVSIGNPDNFSFVYVGDPQIGASAGQIPSDSSIKQNGDIAARNDAYNWNKTLNSALAQHPEINFLVSPGDQINEPAADGNPEKKMVQEYQYAGYLSAAALRNLPEATSIGNHDSMTNSYEHHFNVPNPFVEEENPTKAGHGYFYTYGNALFIVINANNYNVADHKKLLEKAIKASPNTKWRIVVMHQDIYGSGLDHSDSDGILLRTQLTPLYDANHIDVVLQGHDHTYARTYQLTSNGRTAPDFNQFTSAGQSGQQHPVLSTALKDANYKKAYVQENMAYTVADMKQGTLINPKGVFYMTSNSATGSKYYELLPQQQDYVAVRSQTWRPTYSVINITSSKFTITTYDAETGSPIDDAYSIIKN